MYPEALRYDKSLGNSEVYSRVVSSGKFLNFSTQQFEDTESSSCRSFMSEYTDSSPVQSWYYTQFELPAGGPYAIEIIRVSTGETVGNDFVAFVGGDGQYVPQSASTLQNILDVVLQKMAKLNKAPQIDFITAANTSLAFIYKRLMTKKSDLIANEFVQPVSMNPVTLPTNFEGFSERPYISGNRRLLNPLPSETRSQFDMPGDPRFYTLRGFTMNLVPPPVKQITIVGQYYMRPYKFSSFTDAVPLNGLIDNLLAEIIVKVSILGLDAITDQTFRNVYYQMIDEILPFRAPRQVSWGMTIEGGQRR